MCSAGATASSPICVHRCLSPPGDVRVRRVRLVADFGGTRTRLAWVRPGGELDLQSLRVVPTSADPARLLHDYLDAHGVSSAPLACCGAGPVREDGSLALTNVECMLAPANLANAVRHPSVRVLNDFAAVAQGLPALHAQDLRAFGGGSAVAGAPRVVLGPGTGLGVATVLTSGDGRLQVLTGEGGHVDLAPVSEEEAQVWRRLGDQMPRVSAESVLSGPGLERLHLALHADSDALTASEISISAQAGAPRSQRTLQFFSRWLGRVAGNLALTMGARGGIYLAGGIVPAWGAAFDEHAFRAGFESKPPMQGWLREIHTAVITHPQPGLLGLAQLHI